MTFEEYLRLKSFKEKSISAHLIKMKKLGTFDSDHVSQELIRVLNRCTKATANKYLNTYRLYGRYLMETEQLTPDDLSWLKKFKQYRESHRQRVCFSNRELVIFLSYHDLYDVYFKILARTGARPMEIASLKKRDIDWSNNLLLIQESKTGEGRTVPIPEELSEEFYNYLKHHSSEWCFPLKYHPEKHITLESMRKAFKIRRDTLGINPELTPYCLRHTFITRILAAGVPLFVVQGIVGHKNANTTQGYFHLNMQMQKEAMKRDPLVWSTLGPQEKLKTVREYICQLGLDTDKDFTFTYSNRSLKIQAV